MNIPLPLPSLYAHLFLRACGDPACFLVGPSIHKEKDMFVGIESCSEILIFSIVPNDIGLRWMGYYGGWSQKPQLGLGNWWLDCVFNPGKHCHNLSIAGLCLSLPKLSRWMPALYHPLERGHRQQIKLRAASQKREMTIHTIQKGTNKRQVSFGKTRSGCWLCHVQSIFDVVICCKWDLNVTPHPFPVLTSIVWSCNAQDWWQRPEQVSCLSSWFWTRDSTTSCRFDGYLPDHSDLGTLINWNIVFLPVWNMWFVLLVWCKLSTGIWPLVLLSWNNMQNASFISHLSQADGAPTMDLIGLINGGFKDSVCTWRHPDGFLCSGTPDKCLTPQRMPHESWIPVDLLWSKNLRKCFWIHNQNNIIM